MVELRKITPKNVRACLDLSPGAHGKDFVAPNVVSLAQAYVWEKNDQCTVMPFAIYKDEELVGFIQLSYATPEQDEDLDEPAYDVWRFMIDEKYQGNGYGKEALKKAIDYIKTFPCGPAGKAYLSYVPGNDGASGLYKSIGFVETGEISHGEVVMELDLTKV